MDALELILALLIAVLFVVELSGKIGFRIRSCWSSAALASR